MILGAPRKIDHGLLRDSRRGTMTYTVACDVLKFPVLAEQTDSHLKQTQRRKLRDLQHTVTFRIQTVNMQEQPGLSNDKGKLLAQHGRRCGTSLQSGFSCTHAMSISLQLRAYKPGDHVICRRHITSRVDRGSVSNHT